MAIHSLNSLEMPLLASAFSSVLPHVICGLQFIIAQSFLEAIKSIYYGKTTEKGAAAPLLRLSLCRWFSFLFLFVLVPGWTRASSFFASLSLLLLLPCSSGR